MAFLDVFRSDTELRRRAALAYQDDVQRHKALFQQYIDSCEKKLDLGEAIWKAAIAKRIPYLRRNLAGHPTTPVEREVPAQDLTLCASERTQMLALFNKEFLQLQEGERLTRDEEKLLRRMGRYSPQDAVNLDADLRKSSEHLASLLVLLRTLSAILHKEALLIRELQTDIRVIYELSDLVGQEKTIFLSLPIFKSEALFDELMASAHDAAFLADLDEKIHKARERLIVRFRDRRRTIAQMDREERAADPTREEDMKLCETIYETILEQVGAPFSDHEEGERGLEKMERIIDDDKRLGAIIGRVVKDPAIRDRITKRFRDACANLDFEHISLYT